MSNMAIPLCPDECARFFYKNQVDFYCSLRSREMGNVVHFFRAQPEKNEQPLFFCERSEQ
jgi:hypothetical protein